MTLAARRQFPPQRPIDHCPATRAALSALAYALAMLLLLGGTTPADAQVPPASAPQAAPLSPEPGSDLRIFLMTMGPGEELWEKFGHNALLVIDTRHGTGIAYNYGMFDFDQEDFVANFLFGRMNYWMQGFPDNQTLAQYVNDDRSVWVQELNLTPAQRQKLADFLQWNEQPENRFYRYDYYRDNCSTRVRDTIDRAMDGKLHEQLAQVPTETTYRWHTRRIMADNVPLYTAVDAVLGQPGDRELSAWEEAFLPLRLQAHLREVKVPDEQGRLVPLVKLERTLHQSARPPERSSPPNWLGWYLLVGLGLGGALAALAYLGRWSPLGTWSFAILAALWALIVGGGGLFGAWAWLFTQHVAAFRNENLLQFNPLALALVVLIPAAAMGRPWARRGARWVAGAVLVGALLGVAIQVLPVFSQVNGQIVALTLPVTLAVTWGVWRITRTPLTNAGRAATVAVDAAEPARDGLRNRKRD